MLYRTGRPSLLAGRNFQLLTCARIRLSRIPASPEPTGSARTLPTRRSEFVGGRRRSGRTRGSASAGERNRRRYIGIAARECAPLSVIPDCCCAYLGALPPGGGSGVTGGSRALWPGRWRAAGPPPPMAPAATGAAVRAGPDAGPFTPLPADVTAAPVAGAASGDASCGSRSARAPDVPANATCGGRRVCTATSAVTQDAPRCVGHLCPTIPVTRRAGAQRPSRPTGRVAPAMHHDESVPCRSQGLIGR